MTSAARSVREGMLAVVPAFLVSALLWGVAGVLEMIDSDSSVAPLLRYPYLQLGDLVPLLLTAGVAFMAAVRAGLPRIATTLLSIVLLELALASIDGHGVDPAAIAPFLAIALPLATVRLIALTYGVRALRILQLPVAGNSTLEALNLVIPGLLAAAAVATSALALNWLGIPEAFVSALGLIPTDGSLLSGVGTTIANSVLWSVGVHGYLALRPTFDQLDVGVTLNAQDVLAGGAGDHLVNGSFLGAFGFVGGSGATLSLVVAILLFCRGTTLRMLAVASLPLALFNVNEVLLFGLPIVFNPRLWLPFVAVPAVNVCVAYAATKLGILPPVVEPLPLNAPLLVNSYVVTDGSLVGPLFQLALIAMGTAIYAPFARAMERGTSTDEARELLRGLDGSFARIIDETHLLGHDRAVVPKTYYENLQRHNEAVRRLAPHSLELHYQPQLSRTSCAVTGSEALLRLRGADGTPHPPGELLSWLSLVGLEPQLDLWVAERAVEQVSAWRAAGLNHHTTINLSAATLNHPSQLRAISGVLAEGDGRVHLEITEHALTEQRPETIDTLARLREGGVRISLDDFGCGYSSLSYLHQLPIDAVKVDRSFVQALESERAERVLLGLVRLVDDLDLKIVIEGVETNEQLEKIPQTDSISIQGWLYSPALPTDSFAAFAADPASSWPP